MDNGAKGAAWLRTVAAELNARGLWVRTHQANAGVSLTARLPTAPMAEVVMDDTGYAEIRCWAPLSTSPASVAAALMGALAQFTALNMSGAAAGVSFQTPGPGSRYDVAVPNRAGDRAMSAPPDRLIDPAPDAVADTPREAYHRHTDMDERLERLPLGHPSSPYDGDGSRRPDPPNLADYELPLPDDTDPDLPEHDLPRTNEDGSWDWKGLHLTPEQARVGDQAIEHCRAAEGRDTNGNYGDHGMTPAMRRIEAQLENGRLVDGTEQFALKSPDRFKEKLAKLAERHPDEDPRDLATSIHDGIRYTFLFGQDEYANGVEDAVRKLEDTGAEMVLLKNAWSEAEYKGINTRWHDLQTNTSFEVQFHTPESWVTKQRTHEAYEKITDARTPAFEIEALREFQRKTSDRLPVPPGCEQISDYRKELQ